MMLVVNMFEAKTTLSKLVEAIESGKESEVIIARHGTPVARLAPIPRQPVAKRIGVAKGEFVVPDDIDADNEHIAALFQESIS
ncbi:type II toxin-antitoxin system Phd/YefM family antitoxin [Desulfonatronum sp. SC1]|uniref:type II toxin-antitoxin system Phd/YefM family antitoxin n=1 Tax=Desulfonatronum sp. SC1 TaxID=2109626 RepID=UPI0018EEC1A0|nr:type II toxin-antitoxin system Phd/YefM family antitoxin [Desulfonatronum sp. SC1]